MNYNIFLKTTVNNESVTDPVKPHRPVTEFKLEKQCIKAASSATVRECNENSVRKAYTAKGA